MPGYNVTRASSALSTTNDTLTIVAAASRRIKIKSVAIGGLGTASAANVVMMQRSTGGVTPGGAITPEKKETDTPAAGATVNTTWGTQPTLSGSPIERMPVNANGGLYIKRWPPGDEPIIAGGAQMSFRSETGTSNVSISVEFDE